MYELVLGRASDQSRFRLQNALNWATGMRQSLGALATMQESASRWTGASVRGDVGLTCCFESCCPSSLANGRGAALLCVAEASAAKRAFTMVNIPSGKHG